ncbi:cob(I)yrinic acid a,c-diamide adenosyltransferase [Georgenia faecalis]|uniref:cob(I)yrinic acid a,c-diamide adenosyltransferase n=1 Tax=Georgenia faecalis TaxID=2483799 RepID=UPI000FD7CC71|nr:cob(I)yrinic acid a,c-diamide adenosyltransferase [Georgenia faecalis]
MTRIYTRTGDDGTTGLFFGGRIDKADVLMDACGDVDEAVAVLGVARARCEDGTQDGGPDAAEAVALAALLLGFQRELFVVAADLATHPERRRRLEPGVSLVSAEMVDGLERLIDAEVARRPLRPVFIVPGATALSAALDHARTVVRRAERHALRARAAGHVVTEDAARYLNRLSDLLFVLARSAAGDAEEPASHD